MIKLSSLKEEYVSVNFKTLQKNQGHVIVALSGGQIVNIKASWSMNAMDQFLFIFKKC